MLSMSSGNTLITAYRLDAPLGVDCESGVKDGKGTGMGVSRVGNGEPMNNVGVSVTDGGGGALSARDWVQAPSAKMSNREVSIFLFIIIPSTTALSP